MSLSPPIITLDCAILGKRGQSHRAHMLARYCYIILRANPPRHMANESRRSAYCLTLFLMSGHAAAKGSVSGYQHVSGQIIRVSEHQIASQSDYADVNTDYSDG
jgi:hypothetical protein